MTKEELNVVMEIGTFDEINIKDPTKIKVTGKQDDIDKLIEESIKSNADIKID